MRIQSFMSWLCLHLMKSLFNSLYCHNTSSYKPVGAVIDWSLNVCLTGCRWLTADAGGLHNCGCWRWYWVSQHRTQSTQETSLCVCVCLGALFYKPGSVINCGMGQVRLGQWRLCPLFVLFLTISGHYLGAGEREKRRLMQKKKKKTPKKTNPPVCYLNTEKFMLWSGLKFCDAI